MSGEFKVDEKWYQRSLNLLKEITDNSQKEITKLKAEIEALKKELALQKLSDIGQEIEDRDSAIYATGYWNGIEKAKPRELTDEEILELSNTMPYANRFEFARAVLKKATEK